MAGRLPHAVVVLVVELVGQLNLFGEVLAPRAGHGVVLGRRIVLGRPGLKPRRIVLDGLAAQRAGVLDVVGQLVVEMAHLVHLLAHAPAPQAVGTVVAAVALVEEPLAVEGQTAEHQQLVVELAQMAVALGERRQYVRGRSGVDPVYLVGGLLAENADDNIQRVVVVHRNHALVVVPLVEVDLLRVALHCDGFLALPVEGEIAVNLALRPVHAHSAADDLCAVLEIALCGQPPAALVIALGVEGEEHAVPFAVGMLGAQLLVAVDGLGTHHADASLGVVPILIELHSVYCLCFHNLFEFKFDVQSSSV